MNTKINLWAILRPIFSTALLALCTNNAYAAFPNLLGTYSGTDNNTQSMCTNPADNGSFTDPISLTISAQDGSGGFGGSVSDTTDPLSISGTVDSAGNITGGYTSTNESGSFSGTFTSGTLSISYSGSDSSTGCLVSGSFVASGGNPVYVPNTAPSTALTTQQTLTTSVTTFSTAVTQRLTSLRSNNPRGLSKLSNGFMLQSGSGMSSGDKMDGPLGVWGSINYSRSEDDFSSTAFDARRGTMMFGADMSPNENFIIGLAVGYEDSKIDTKFNNGEVNSDGFTFITYGTYMLNDTFSIDAIGGFSQINANQYRTDPDTAARISSSTDSDRLFFSGNLNASRQYDNWFVTGRAGVLVAVEGQAGFTESNGRVVVGQDFRIGQARLGAEAAYQMDSAWEPYGSLTFEYDYSRTKIGVAAGSPQPTFDRTGSTLGLGMRYFARNGVTGNLEYSRVLGRSHYSEGTLNMTLRAEF